MFKAGISRTCRYCGCDDLHGCVVDEDDAPCHWVEADLCSACVHEAVQVRIYSEGEAAAFLRQRGAAQ
jgi:hypothetical protein